MEPEYIISRLVQDERLRTAELSEAHLCYPACSYVKEESLKYTDRHGAKRSFYFDRGR